MENISSWYAIRTPKDSEVERMLAAECDEVFFPKEYITTTSGAKRLRPVIPHVLFIRTTEQNAIALETRGRDTSDSMLPFWIYRYSKNGKIQRIADYEIALLRLLTAQDSTKCEIYGRTDYECGQYVRIKAGSFAGLTGYVQRVKKNKHVIVRIEGICSIMLPFIHPDLLEVI